MELTSTKGHNETTSRRPFEHHRVSLTAIIMKCNFQINYRQERTCYGLPGEKDRVNAWLAQALVGTTWLYADVRE